jgi:hypothetical protein
MSFVAWDVQEKQFQYETFMSYTQSKAFELFKYRPLTVSSDSKALQITNSTELTVCVCACVSVYPAPSLLGNGSVKIPLSLQGNGSVKIPLSLLGKGSAKITLSLLGNGSIETLPR